MIIVHHLNNSRSQRVLWLLEELAVDYDVKRYQRDAKTMLAPDASQCSGSSGGSDLFWLGRIAPSAAA